MRQQVIIKNKRTSEKAHLHERIYPSRRNLTEQLSAVELVKIEITCELDDSVRRQTFASVQNSLSGPTHGDIKMFGIICPAL